MGMTITEKIMAKSSGKEKVIPGENIWLNVDTLMTHDVCGPPTFQIWKNAIVHTVAVHAKDAVANACTITVKWDSSQLVILIPKTRKLTTAQSQNLLNLKNKLTQQFNAKEKAQNRKVLGFIFFEGLSLVPRQFSCDAVLGKH